MDYYAFYTGQCFDAYTWLGAHREGEEWVFRTFAPGAAGVVLLHGDRELPMERIHDGNFYEIRTDGVKPGDCYQYRIYRRDGGYTDHCDPYGFGMELRPGHCSVVRDLGEHTYQDEAWMAGRSDRREEPLNIYELHLGSWRRKPDGGWYRYDELAQPLITYIKESGYNYVEFLPLSEHPCDESWGYQITGFYAPTSRYGTAKELMMLIDRLHQAGIGVILDFVPAHFAVDDYGLARYDGTALYEYPHRDVEVSEWGSHNFMHSRGEVRSFLQSCARYWLEVFHFDGLRMDAISRILYWQGDEARGVNGDGAAFLRTMNRGLKSLCPGCILAAEDSTNFPKVTAPAEQGGLGFDYKWDMGWMHDTLSYFQTPPEERPQRYHQLTFSMHYFHQERYLLPLSHDEVVHGKATILQKMHGDYDGKFPQARSLYLYMMVHPSKKLNFMGNEIGHFREWDERREQDWLLRDFPIHDAFYHYMAELNHIYLNHPALSQWDYRPEGFAWLDCRREEACVYVIQRQGGGERLVALLNLSDQARQYELPATEGVELLLHTDWQRFGGRTPEEECPQPAGGILTVCLPPYSGQLYRMK